MNISKQTKISAVAIGITFLLTLISSRNHLRQSLPFLFLIVLLNGYFLLTLNCVTEGIAKGGNVCNTISWVKTISAVFWVLIVLAVYGSGRNIIPTPDKPKPNDADDDADADADADDDADDDADEQ